MASRHFLRSIVNPDTTVTVSTQQSPPIDLPVNPITVLWLKLIGTEVAESVGGLASMLNTIANFVTNVQVQLLGQNIINGSLTDLMYFNARAFGMYPKMTRMVGTTGAVRAWTFPLCFSRKPYWDEEALPPVARGNLRFFITFGALPAQITTPLWQLESVELLDAKPTRYCKYIQNTKALTATGQFDAPLPIGNPMFGIMLFEPSIFGTTANALSWGQVKLLVDNVEQYFPLSDWESIIAGSEGEAIFNPFMVSDHRHIENLAAAYAQAAITDATIFNGPNSSPDQYGYLDFDPLSNSEYLLETAGHADVKLRGFADTGAPNGTVLWYPGELVTIQ
jgi:hypothetical protein